MRDTGTSLEEELFELLSYMVASAQGLFEEPCVYGPLRLLEASRRLLDTMHKHGMLGDDALELKRMIDENIHLVLSDEEAFEEFVGRLVERLADLISKQQ